MFPLLERPLLATRQTAGVLGDFSPLLGTYCAPAGSPCWDPRQSLLPSLGGSSLALSNCSITGATDLPLSFLVATLEK